MSLKEYLITQTYYRINNTIFANHKIFKTFQINKNNINLFLGIKILIQMILKQNNYKKFYKKILKKVK